MANQIALLRERAITERRKALASLVHATSKEDVKFLYPQIDESKTSYEKGIDKEYVFSESEDFSEEFSLLIDFDLLDYGVDDTTGALVRDVHDRGQEMSLDVDWAAPKTRVQMHGAFFGDAGSFESLGDGLKAKFRVVGVPVSHTLALYEELLIEGFCMERINRRLALFCYFSAAECVIIDLIAEYQRGVAPELHYALERLSISDKVRVVGRALVPDVDVTKLEIWGLMLGTLQSTAKIRNNIAHPHQPYSVTEADVDQAFLAFLLLHSILVEKKTTAMDVIRLHFKKTAMKAQSSALGRHPT